MSARTIIIGDVHGMLVELRNLIHILQPNTEDTIVFVGDIIDKGPESAGVVKYTRGLCSSTHVRLTLGNHEDKHARFRRAFAKAGDKVKMKGIAEMKALMESLSPEDISFLESAAPYHRVPEHNALVVHAGILPSLESLPSQETYTALSKGERSKFDRVLRVRHITGASKATVTVEFDLDGMTEDDISSLSPQEVAERCSQAAVIRTRFQPQGSFISLGQETESDPFWADVYGTDERGPRFGHVYFGHSPFIGDKPAQYPHATGLDTGCVFGGHLTAAVLTSGQETRFVSVPARGKFASHFWEV